MKSICQNTRIFFFIILLGICCPVQADAVMQFEASASEDGFALQYFAPLVGAGKVELEEPGDSGMIPVQFMLLKVADLELTLNEIITDPGRVNLHYVMTTFLISPEQPSAFEGDLPVPFGQYGATVNLLGRRLPPTNGHDIDSSVLLVTNRSEYKIRVNMLPVIIDEEWSGTATPSENTIHEEVRSSIDDSLLLEVDLQFEYPSDFMTTIQYKVINYISPAVTSQSQTGTDNETEFTTISLPNGSYNVWADTDIELLPQF